MANTLRFKRGLVSGIPTAALGEPLFTTDTFDLYIGNGTTNTRFQKYIASGTTSQLLRGDGSLLTMPIVLTSPSTGQVLKYNGTNWVNDSDAGVTGSGTTNYLPKFTGASTLGNSLLQEGTNAIGLNITPSAWSSSNAMQIGNFASLSSGNAFGTGIGFNNFFNGTNHIYSSSNFASILQQSGGQFRFYTAALGSTGGTITWSQPMTLFASGNLAVGSTNDNGLRFQVTGDGYFSGSVGIGRSPDLVTNYGVLSIGGTTGTFYRAYTGSTETFRISTTSTTSFIQSFSGNLRFDAGSVTNAMTLFSTGNLVVGSATDAGFKLDVNGTMRVSGAATFSSTIAVGGTATFTNPSSVNIVGTSTLVGATARNTSTASGDTQAGFFVENGTSNGQLYKAGTGYTTRKTIAANDLGFYNAAAGNISILNDFASGSIILTAGGSSIAQWTIGANGDLTAADGENIIVGTTNGTKIGTSGSQKLGFWNATPIVQPNNSVAAANFVAGIGTSVTTLDAFDGYTIGQVVRALRNAGILS